MNPPVIRQHKNRVLASLPRLVMKQLAIHLSPEVFKQNRTLHDPGEIVDTVYFLEDGICSIVVTMENGSTVEVGITGRDGFVGMPAVLGTDSSPNRSLFRYPAMASALRPKFFVNKPKRLANYAGACSEAFRDCLHRPRRQQPVIAFTSSKNAWPGGF